MNTYIVLDLEWNQCPDGKSGALDHLPFEIIEIGAVLLNEKFQEVSQFHRLIRPRVYHQIHFKISEVTHVEMEELEGSGEDFETVVADFFSWCGGNGIFCTWGAMDLTELQRNMKYFGVENPFPKPLFYYDVQKLFSLLYSDGKTRIPLETAVDALGIRRDRPFHRAMDDAHYTGLVMEKMDFCRVEAYRSVDYFRLPESREEEIRITFPSYAKYVSRVFATREDAAADRAVTELACYRCKKTLKKKVRWFSPNQKVYFALAVCPEHGFVKGKIRVKRTCDGRCYAVKTTKIVDEDGARKILQRKEEMRKKRCEKKTESYKN